jgi:hypothetical protein
MWIFTAYFEKEIQEEMSSGQRVLFLEIRIELTSCQTQMLVIEVQE